MFIDNWVENGEAITNIYYYGKPRFASVSYIGSKLDDSISYIVTGCVAANNQGHVGISLKNNSRDSLSLLGEIEFFNICDINQVTAMRFSQNDFYSNVLKSNYIQRPDFMVWKDGKQYLVDVKARAYLKDGQFFLNHSQIRSYRWLNKHLGMFVLCCIKQADLKPLNTVYYSIFWDNVEEYLKSINYDVVYNKNVDDWIVLPYSILNKHLATEFFV